MQEINFSLNDRICEFEWLKLCCKMILAASLRATGTFSFYRQSDTVNCFDVFIATIKYTCSNKCSIKSASWFEFCTDTYFQESDYMSVSACVCVSVSRPLSLPPFPSLRMQMRLTLGVKQSTELIQRLY